MNADVAVVGAGISGLAAAWELDNVGADVIVLEASDRPGGKIDGSEVGGIMVDAGPDGFLIREPDMTELCRELGLSDELVVQEAGRARVWSGEALRPLPEKSLLGVPYDADAASRCGVLSSAGLAVLRRGLELRVSPPDGDAAVGPLLRPHTGDEVFDRLIDPLLGGIHAGPADEMSVAACAPSLYEAIQLGGQLGPALRTVARRQAAGRHVASMGEDGLSSSSEGGAAKAAVPPFRSVRGGVASIVKALVSRLGKSIRLETPVVSLERGRSGSGKSRGWRLLTPQGAVSAKAVVLATPAWVAADLTEPHSPDAAAILGGIGHADVAVVTFVLPAERIVQRLDGSGFLVPRSAGLLTTACSWTSCKWEHCRLPDRVVLRVSAGRFDDTRWLDLDRAELVTVLGCELVEFGLLDDSRGLAGDSGKSMEDSRRLTDTGVNGTDESLPAVRVTPWMRSLPQYRPGHLERIDAVDAHLKGDVPGLMATGAAFRGLGLPTCVRQARTTAIKALAAATSWD